MALKMNTGLQVKPTLNDSKQVKHSRCSRKKVTFVIINKLQKANKVQAGSRAATTFFFHKHVLACKAIFRDSNYKAHPGNIKVYITKCNIINTKYTVISKLLV